jgi:putative polyhydroxyalkanoate system protein
MFATRLQQAFGLPAEGGVGKMSKSVSVVIAHELGADGAKERIAAGVPKFEPTFGRAATLEQAAWAGDTLTFSIRAMAVRATGTVTVTENEVRIEANLPMVLAPFSGMIERLIGEHGGQLLRPTLDPQDVAQTARQAAQAAGQNWQRLSEEERRLYREQARQELLSTASPNGASTQIQ